MKVIEYLKSGKTLNDLKNEFGITHRFDKKEELVILNYDQIESPKTNPIVMECRQLILENKTWNIVARSFQRFFNYGEGDSQDFDFSNAYITEKIDGSILSLFNYKNEWRIATRSVIDGENFTGDFNITFKELINKAFSKIGLSLNDKRLNPLFCYIFELVSPENKVVKFYPEPEIYLLGVRTTLTWTEFGYEEFGSIAKTLNCKRPQRYSLNSIEAIKESFSKLPPTDEGYVCVNENSKINGNFSRVKVKNPSYLALSHLKGQGETIASLFTIIRKGEEEELLVTFPEFKDKVEVIKNIWIKYIENFKQELNRINVNELDKKTFALSVKDSLYAPIFFSMYNKRCNSLEEYYINMGKEKSEKNVSRKLMEILNIKEEIGSERN